MNLVQKLTTKYKVTAADKWLSAKPKECQLCHKKFKEGDAFIDGAMKAGPWALMCEKCFKTLGVGRLGLGFGQKYDFKTCDKLSDK